MQLYQHRIQLFQKQLLGIKNFDKFNIRFLSPTYCPPVRGSSDVSNTGLTAKVFIDSKLNTVYKNFSIEEKDKNSTGMNFMQFITHY